MKTKRKQPFRPHMSLLPSNGCRLDFVILQLYFRVVCSPFFCDVVDDSMELFIDDLLVFGDTFE